MPPCFAIQRKPRTAKGAAPAWVLPLVCLHLLAAKGCRLRARRNGRRRAPARDAVRCSARGLRHGLRRAFAPQARGEEKAGEGIARGGRVHRLRGKAACRTVCPPSIYTAPCAPSVSTTAAPGNRARKARSSASSSAPSVSASCAASTRLSKNRSTVSSGSSSTRASIGDGLHAMRRPRACACRMRYGRPFISFCSSSQSPAVNEASVCSTCCSVMARFAPRTAGCSCLPFYRSG